MKIDRAQHPDPLTLDDFVDAILSADETAAVGAHLESCFECSEYVDRVRSLNGSLAQLPARAAMYPPIDDIVREWIHAHRQHRAKRWRVALPVAAAACGIFVAGILTGQKLQGAGGSSAPGSSTQLEEPAYEVQRAGSSYIAALARARSGRSEVTREVAASTLFGAATEAARVFGNRGSSEQLVLLARAVRDEAVAESGPRE
jgi:anti-sigma factor RsiW